MLNLSLVCDAINRGGGPVAVPSGHNHECTGTDQRTLSVGTVRGKGIETWVYIVDSHFLF